MVQHQTRTENGIHYEWHCAAHPADRLPSTRGWACRYQLRELLELRLEPKTRVNPGY
jgi:hypothetical protein